MRVNYVVPSLVSRTFHYGEKMVCAKLPIRIRRGGHDKRIYAQIQRRVEIKIPKRKLESFRKHIYMQQTFPSLRFRYQTNGHE